MHAITLSLSDSLLETVKDTISAAMKRPVSNEEALSLLGRHPRILGSIVAYDEVDTEDRYAIWEALDKESSGHEKD